MPSSPHQAAPAIVEGAAGSLVDEGGPALLYAFTIPDGITADLDFTCPNYTSRLVEFYAVKTGATAAASAGNAVQAQTGASVAISDALAMDVADEVLIRATTLDTDNDNFAAGATFRIERTKVGQDASCICYGRFVRV